MEIKRLWHTFRLWTIKSSWQRAVYLKKHKIFRDIGQHCTVMDRKVPLYANLIKIGSNVHITSNVSFVTHDVVHDLLNGYKNSEISLDKKMESKMAYRENIGCIEIGNNVMIGTGTVIMSDVKIGDNVIIGAGSIVTDDIPSNSVAVGSPAKVVKTFAQYIEKRDNREKSMRPENMNSIHQRVDKEMENWMWSDFKNRHFE